MTARDDTLLDAGEASDAVAMHAGDYAKAKDEKRRRKLVPIEKRCRLDDCEPGDVVRFTDARQAVVTAWLNHGPMVRYVDGDGVEGELEPADGRLPITRIRGLR